MLAPKKIEKNKLIIYVSVIIVMIAGTGFFLYKNYSSTAIKKLMTMEAPAETSGQSSYSLDNLLKETNLEEEGAGAGEEKGADLTGEDLKKEKKLLDLDLLANAKFKKLRENTIKEGGFEVGKSNLFFTPPPESEQD